MVISRKGMFHCGTAWRAWPKVLGLFGKYEQYQEQLQNYSKCGNEDHVWGLLDKICLVMVMVPVDGE